MNVKYFRKHFYNYCHFLNDKNKLLLLVIIVAVKWHNTILNPENNEHKPICNITMINSRLLYDPRKHEHSHNMEYMNFHYI